MQHAVTQLHVDQHGVRVVRPIHQEWPADPFAQCHGQIVVHGAQDVHAFRVRRQVRTGADLHAQLEVGQAGAQDPGLVGLVVGGVQQAYGLRDLAGHGAGKAAGDEVQVAAVEDEQGDRLDHDERDQDDQQRAS